MYIKNHGKKKKSLHLLVWYLYETHSLKHRSRTAPRKSSYQTQVKIKSHSLVVINKPQQLFSPHSKHKNYHEFKVISEHQNSFVSYHKIIVKIYMRLSIVRLKYQSKLYPGQSCSLSSPKRKCRGQIYLTQKPEFCCNLWHVMTNSAKSTLNA